MHVRTRLGKEGEKQSGLDSCVNYNCVEIISVT